MTAQFRRLVLLVTFLLAAAGVANAQTSASGSNDDDWKVAIYPILAWVPLGIGIDVDVPPIEGGGGGGSAEIIDGRFDGAYLGGFSASKGWFRIDADGLWAAVGGDRPELPFLRVDVDAIYFHVVGRREGGPGLLPHRRRSPVCSQVQRAVRRAARVRTEAGRVGSPHRRRLPQGERQVRSAHHLRGWRLWRRHRRRTRGHVPRGLEAGDALRPDRAATTTCTSRSKTRSATGPSP